MNFLSKLFNESKPDPLMLKIVADLYVGDLICTGYRILNIQSTSGYSSNNQKFKIKSFNTSSGKVVEEEMQGDTGVWIVAEKNKYGIQPDGQESNKESA